MWGVRSEWETHLNEHPIPNAEGGDIQRYTLTCKICSRTYGREEYVRREEPNNPFCNLRNSHYAEHMERIALAVGQNYGPGSSSQPQTRVPVKRFKRRRRLKKSADFGSGHGSSSSSGHDKEAMSGWSSEGSTGGRDYKEGESE